MTGEPAAAAAAAADAFARYGEDLVAAVDAVLGGWVAAAVLGRWQLYHGTEAPAEVRGRAVLAGDTARAEVVPALRELLALDAEQQWTNPLALVRRAVRPATAALHELGVPPVVRDRFAEQAFPEDLYALVPASFADIDPSLHDPGLVWGAAKAHVVLLRRKGGRPSG